MNDVSQLISDQLAAHNTAGYVIAGVAVVLFLLPLVLKAAGKSVPFLDPIVEGLVTILKGLNKQPPAPTPEEKTAETAKEPGVAAVTNVVEFKPPEQKP